MIEETDQQLFEALKKGSDDAYKKVYIDNKEAFINFARKFPLSDLELLDVYQDVYVAFYENIENKKLLELSSSIRTYLISIGKYMILDRLRKSKKKVLTNNLGYFSAEEDQQLMQFDLERNVPTVKQKLLQQQFNVLGEKCRIILSLFYYKHFTIKQIMEEGNYNSENVVKSQKSRCLKTLRETDVKKRCLTMDKDQLIEHYFLGTLNNEEKRSLETLLETSSEFRQRFEFEKDVQQAIKQNKRAVLKERLTSFETEKKPRKYGEKKWFVLKIAASIALLISVVGIWYFLDQPSNSASLFSENYSKYPNTAYAITRGGPLDNSLERMAFEAYEANKDKEAIQLFLELKNRGDEPYLDFYLGQSLLKNEQITEAIVVFKEIILKENEYSDEALWYTALAYLKLEQSKEAIQFLNQSINNKGYKADQAALLLKEIE